MWEVVPLDWVLVDVRLALESLVMIHCEADQTCASKKTQLSLHTVLEVFK
jgi:hypothetical protein